MMILQRTANMYVLAVWAACAFADNASRRRLERHWLTLGEPWTYEHAVVTSCGEAGASHNNGWWKPKRLMDGVVTMAESLRATGSTLPALFVSFASEHGAHAACRASERLARARVVCFELDDTVRSSRGYGYAKIAAIIAAPVRVVLWIDADAYFASDPSSLFADGAALFWPDFYGHFDPGSYFWDTGLERPDLKTDWASRQGFDSGLLVVDKRRFWKELHRVEVLSRQGTDEHDKWARHSQGDKDLWHLAWMLNGAPYSLSPYAAVVAWRPFNTTGNYMLVAQAKCENRRVVVLHQNWHDVRRDDETALFVVDLRHQSELPWGPDINVGLPYAHDPPRISRIEPAPPRLLDAIAVVRRQWFGSSFAQ